MLWGYIFPFFFYILFIYFSFFYIFDYFVIFYFYFYAIVITSIHFTYTKYYSRNLYMMTLILFYFSFFPLKNNENNLHINTALCYNLFFIIVLISIGYTVTKDIIVHFVIYYFYLLNYLFVVLVFCLSLFACICLWR